MLFGNAQIRWSSGEADSRGSARPRRQPRPVAPAPVATATFLCKPWQATAASLDARLQLPCSYGTRPRATCIHGLRSYSVMRLRAGGRAGRLSSCQDAVASQPLATAEGPGHLRPQALLAPCASRRSYCFSLRDTGAATWISQGLGVMLLKKRQRERERERDRL